jgi:hypothetical protein
MEGVMGDGGEWDGWMSASRAGEPAALLGVTADGWMNESPSVSVSVSKSKSKSKWCSVPSQPDRFPTLDLRSADSLSARFSAGGELS